MILSDEEAEQENVISDDPGRRRDQMLRLVQARQGKTQKHLRTKEAVVTTVEIIVKAKDTIQAALTAYPPAALAWTGASILLEVRSSFPHAWTISAIVAADIL
jgi:hypothetical protein